MFSIDTGGEKEIGPCLNILFSFSDLGNIGMIKAAGHSSDTEMIRGIAELYISLIVSKPAFSVDN